MKPRKQSYTRPPSVRNRLYATPHLRVPRCLSATCVMLDAAEHHRIPDSNGTELHPRKSRADVRLYSRDTSRPKSADLIQSNKTKILLRAAEIASALRCPKWDDRGWKLTAEAHAQIRRPPEKVGQLPAGGQVTRQPANIRDRLLAPDIRE